MPPDPKSLSNFLSSTKKAWNGKFSSFLVKVQTFRLTPCRPGNLQCTESTVPAAKEVQFLEEVEVEFCAVGLHQVARGRSQVRTNAVRVVAVKYGYVFTTDHKFHTPSSNILYLYKGKRSLWQLAKQFRLITFRKFY
jgi:hypothetical protein